LKAHLAHDDTEGECPEERPGKVDDDDDSSDDKTSDNREPIAIARADSCVLFGSSHELDGTDSYDPDGDYDDLDFDWDVVNRPSGSDLVDADLSPNDDDDDPRFTPDRLGTFGFALTVEDPDGASDTDLVETEAYIDVYLDDTEYEVDEDDTVAVKITLSDEAPQDVEVTLSVDDEVVVFVEDSTDDESDEITEVTIDAGDDEVTVYLYGLVDDSDFEDESTDITVSIESDDCPVSDSASVDVEDDDEKEVAATTTTVQLFIREMAGFWIV
jgi:hypothetical protein